MRHHIAWFGARLRSSLWLAPAVALVIVVGISAVAMAIDTQIPPDATGWFLFGGQPESAQEILTTIASAMLQFTALVFSVTIVVLQLASSQFSPRVIRTFLEEPLPKLAMAMFVGTFAYAMIVLTQVRIGTEAFVPAVATWIAFLLVIASIVVFIAYLHHMAHSVRAISLIDRVSAQTRAAIDDMYPEEVSSPASPELPRPDRDPDQLVRHVGPPGVIARIDADAMVAIAQRCGAVVEIVPVVGSFLPTGAVMFQIWGGRLDEERARGVFDLEIERTIDQDPAFGFRELVDIAVRALSPGINDPTTATQALDHLHDLLRRVTVRAFPPRGRVDDTGALRVWANRPGYGEYVELTVEEIIFFARGEPQVIRRLRRMLADCLAIAPPDRRRVLEEQLGHLQQTCP